MPTVGYFWKFFGAELQSVLGSAKKGLSVL